MTKSEYRKLYREYRRFDVVYECLNKSGRHGLANVVRDEFWTKAYANGTESALKRIETASIHRNQEAHAASLLLRMKLLNHKSDRVLAGLS